MSRRILLFGVGGWLVGWLV